MQKKFNLIGVLRPRKAQFHQKLICPLHPHILIYIPLYMYIMVIVFNLLDLFCLSGEWFQLVKENCL